MRLAVIGGALFAVGAVAVATGVLPLEDALVIADRVWPVLLFVVAVTVVAELAASVGVFDLAGAWLARLSRGRVVALWGLVLLLAIAATAFLSLDTTAVLLTPVVVAVARAHRLPPLPFAFATVWLANTASLVLPVSNLTNLLAVHRLGELSPWAFVGLLGPSALVAIVVTVVILTVVFRRDLAGRFEPVAAPRSSDPVLTASVGAVVVVLLPFLVSGIAPWIPALVAAVAVTVLVGVRARRMLRFALIPWQLVVFTAGLFLAVGALEELGSGLVVATLAGSGTGLVDLLRMAGVGALGANAINNLPAYLAIESAAGHVAGAARRPPHRRQRGPAHHPVGVARDPAVASASRRRGCRDPVEQVRGARPRGRAARRRARGRAARAAVTSGRAVADRTVA